MILKNKSEQFSAKGFYEALQIHLVTKDWNITNLWGKEIKQNTLWKKTIPKGKITKYIEYKLKNTGTSIESIHISRSQYFNSSTKYWKQHLNFSYKVDGNIIVEAEA